MGYYPLTQGKLPSPDLRLEILFLMVCFLQSNNTYTEHQWVKRIYRNFILNSDLLMHCTLSPTELLSFHKRILLHNKIIQQPKKFKVMNLW